MHEYDVALKKILTRPPSSLLAALTGSSTLHWLNVEAPLVRNLRVDLLGETPDGELIHIELQSRNEPRFYMRMGEYSFAVALRYGKLPRQVGLYVGSEPLNMESRISWTGGEFRFDLIDIRNLDGEALLASENPGDNVVSILTRMGSEPEAVRRVLKRIADGSPDDSPEALAELSIIAGLRKLAGEVRRETRLMPIQESILDHEVIGPLVLRGRIEGRIEGRVEGQFALLLRQIEKRFGEIPPSVLKRITALPSSQVEIAGLRLLDAIDIEDLFTQ